MAFEQYHLKRMKSGIECYNKQEYWECHEELEHIWIEDKQDPARNVYWAVIQVAAAMIHYRDKNIVGAQGLINKARDKFKKCHELQVLSKLTSKYLDWEEFEKLSTIIPSEKARLEDFSTLFDWRFLHYNSEGT